MLGIDHARRWELVLPHRERLLRLARSLVRDPGDAEACVQEALTRCVTFENLDEDNVAAFLVATTRRICVDHHRAHDRAVRLAARVSGQDAVEPAPEDAVCDRAEAAWVSQRLADLPRRQRDVVMARAEGYSPQEIAARLRVSYKTVETLLYRVRVRTRAELERAYNLVALFAARRGRVDLSAVTALPVAVVTAGVAVAGGPPAMPAPRAVPAAVVSAAATRPRPASPRVTPAAVPRPRDVAPSRPRPAAKPSPSALRSLAPCDFPPYWADPCYDPQNPAMRGAVDCVEYVVGIDTRKPCERTP